MFTKHTQRRIILITSQIYMSKNKDKTPSKFVWGSALVIVLSVSVFIYIFKPNISGYISLKNLSLSSVISGVLSSNTNNFRAENNTELLVISDILAKAAEMKARDMAQISYFSHIGPDGEDPWVWFDRVGYDYRYAGENLAIDFTESVDVTDAWIDSAKHKANLLNPNFTEVGVGIAEGFYEGRATVFVVQFFGQPVGAVSEAVSKEDKVLLEDEAIHVLNNPDLPVVTKKGLAQGEVLGVTDFTTTRNMKKLYGGVGLLAGFLVFWALYSKRKRLFKKIS